MVTLSGVGLHFGGRTLYSNVSFQINPGDRIGLTGKNGAGKSTLLRMIKGTQMPSEGSIQFPSQFTIGFLTQDIDTQSADTVFNEAVKAFSHLLSLENRLQKYEHEVATRTDVESQSYLDLLTKMSDVIDDYSIHGGYEYKEKTEKVLTGLGFKKEWFHEPLINLSGGWKMRVELAKIILQNPDLIMLDEPTNHLDIESIIWLEQWLTQRNGALMVISHDKTFLDNVTNRTIEIDSGNIQDYKANYTSYLLQREERRNTLLSAFNNQQKEIERTEKLIDKFRAKANKAAFAQSLIKKLDRMDMIELDESDSSSLRIRFLPAPASGKVVLKIENAKKSFDKLIFDNVNMEVERGEKIAFVGKNGEGKSTLSKMIVGAILGEGKIELGHNVLLGYLAQNDPEMMDNDKTVLDTIEDEAPNEIRPMSRAILGAFLFGNEAVDKKVKVLSGGERTRLAMAKLLLHPYNFMVFDEPTNHLDMRSKEVLKNALIEFKGTLIIVSHDREFLQGLCTKTYEFNNGNVKEYLGDINYFLEKKAIDNMRTLEENYIDKTTKTEIENTDNTNNKTQNKEDKKRIQQKQKIEENIQKIEGEIAELEKRFTDTEFISSKEYQPSLKKYNELKVDLEEKMQEWISL